MPTIAELTGNLFDGSGLPALDVQAIETQIHPRQQILLYVKGQLEANSGQPARIQVARNVSLADSSAVLPACLIYTRTDRFVRKLAHSVELRVLRMAVEVYGLDLDPDLDPEKLEQQLNAAAHVVELVVGRDDTQGGLAHNTLLTDLDVLADDEGRQTLASLRLTYELEYERDLSATVVDDFETAHVDTDLDDDGTGEMVDDVEIPQT